MVRRLIVRGMALLIVGSMVAACKAQPGLPEPTRTPLPPTASATASPTETIEPTPGEPQAPTPDFPTPAAVPLAHLRAGEPLTIQTIKMVSLTAGWAIGRARDNLDRVLRTSDGGVTWADVTVPEAVADPEQPRRGLGHFVDELTAWVVYTGVFGNLGYAPATVWRTEDGGKNWQPSRGAEPPAVAEWFEPIALGSNAQGFGWLLMGVGAGMSHQYVALYTSQDGGVSWTRVLDPHSDQPVQSCPKSGLEFADSALGWMARDCAGLIDRITLEGTRDGGITWAPLDVPAPASMPEGYAYPFLCTAHSLRMPSTGDASFGVSCRQYLETPTAAGEDQLDGPHTLYRSADGGQSWSLLDYPGGDLLWQDEQHAWALGREIYRTADGGTTWTFVHAVNWDGQFSFVDDLHGWAVARNEQEIALVRTQNGGTSWSILKPVSAP